MNPVPSAISASTPAAANTRDQLKVAARGFEAIFLRQMLSAARKADFGGGLFSSEAMGTYRQMQDEHLADLAAEMGTLGMAKMIEAQLARQMGIGERSSTGSAHVLPADLGT